MLFANYEIIVILTWSAKYILSDPLKHNALN